MIRNSEKVETAEPVSLARCGGDAQQLWHDWQRGADLALHQLLACAAELTPLQLVAVLRAEQHERCQRGDLIPAEEYLQRYPALRSIADCAVDIIYSEFLVREQAGQVPRPAEYLHRFPEFAQSLTRQFKVHAAIGVAAPSTAHLMQSHTPIVRALEQAPPSLAPLTRLDRFVIKERLGVGGFGCVYRAHDPQLGRDVALKLAHSHLTTAQYRQRFLREARAAGQLQHPNIVAVYDSGVAPEGCYIAYQLVSGQSLVQVLRQRRFTCPEAAKLICKLAQAAHHAHMKGVVHRDLKAGNVLLDEREEPYISDFGLARLEGESTLTADATVLGTPAYMSPEQALGASHVADARSDVYTLGVLLYELLTGRLPFLGSPHSVLLKLRDHEPPGPRSINQEIPRDLETICLRAMAKRPEHRYASAQHLADDLERWLRHEPIQARRVGPAERVLRWCRRNPLVAALAGTTASLLVAVAVVAIIGGIRAERFRRLAERDRDQANSLLYFAHMREGERAWHDASISRLRELVDQHVPQPGMPDLRGWEWYYLKAHLHRELFTLRGHTDGVASLAWSRDGKWLASASADSSLKTWDAARGQLVRTFHGHTGPVRSIAWSPCGEQLASAGHDQSVRIWDAPTGQVHLSLVGHAADVTAVAWAPDGSRLASGSHDRTVRIWDLVTGTMTHRFTDHADGVSSVAWSPDGHLLASGSRDKTIIVRSAENGQILHVLRGHELEVGPVAWSFDSTRLASSGPDQSIRIWGISSGEMIAEMHGHRHGPSCLAWSPDDQWLASTSNDRMVKIWSVSNKQEVLTLRGHEDGVGTLCWSNHGRHLASASSDRTIRVWDLMSARDPITLEGHTQEIRSIAWNPNGQEIASASDDGTLRIWQASTGRENISLPGRGGTPLAVAWSPDGRYLATKEASDTDANREKSLRILDTTTWTELLTIAGLSSESRAVAWSPDSRRLAGASLSTVKIWEAATGTVLCTLQDCPKQTDSPSDATALAWSPGGKQLAVAYDHGVGLWDSNTGKLDRLLSDKRYGAQWLCFRPDGGRLAAACADGKIRLFDTGGEADPRELSGHTSIAFSVDWHPDGKRLASASYDNTVRIWDVISGQETLSLGAHRSTVWCVAWSPDGKRLASSGYDRTIRVYDATIGYRLAR